LTFYSNFGKILVLRVRKENKKKEKKMREPETTIETPEREGDCSPAICSQFMKASTTSRGFRLIEAEKYQNEPGEFTHLVQESSAVGDYEDSFDKPGSSFLWVGDDHHLSREEVSVLVGFMQEWLKSGRLPTDIANVKVEL
jgi:hypothetical protein